MPRAREESPGLSPKGDQRHKPVAVMRERVGELRCYGGIAQLVEHLLCKQGVIGSNPFASIFPAASCGENPPRGDEADCRRASVAASRGTAATGVVAPDGCPSAFGPRGSRASKTAAGGAGSLDLALAVDL